MPHDQPEPSTPATPNDVQALLGVLRLLTRALAIAATCAITFTAASVTRLAVHHGVPWPTALLLDPTLALSVGTVLIADARLAELGITPPAWATALRWFAGLATAILNIWSSLWPDDHIGVPHHADTTGIVLHAIPPLLLLLLAEAVAAYRKRIHHAIRTLPIPQQSVSPEGPSAPAPPADRLAPRPHPAETPQERLLRQARVFDTHHRITTGRPASIRALRTHFHLGQTSATALHATLSEPTGSDGLASPETQPTTR